MFDLLNALYRIIVSPRDPLAFNVYSSVSFDVKAFFGKDTVVSLLYATPPFGMV
ncbi:TPA: hypothetical protein ACG3PC_000125 [Clostridioides difficile]|uniref:hypothetical protein n=1 Tax=Clostridioides difficile TaxID=1496 RepID=UPI001F22CC84|nr:hypothetical protein [Clostridioides difficile]